MNFLQASFEGSVAANPNLFNYGVRIQFSAARVRELAKLDQEKRDALVCGAR